MHLDRHPARLHGGHVHVFPDKAHRQNAETGHQVAERQQGQELKEQVTL